MTLLPAMLLLLALPRVPCLPNPLFMDQRFELTGEEPQAGGGAVRVTASDADCARVRQLLDHQDECILTHRHDLARADFADDFSASDFHCDSGDEVLARLDDFLHEHQDVHLASEVMRTDRVGGYLVASVRRPFDGVRRADGQRVSDESFQTLVLRDLEGELRISAMYEVERTKLADVDVEQRTYRAGGLAFTLAWPEPFVPVPRSGPGAALDELLLLDPEDGAVAGLMVWEPTIAPDDLAATLKGDLSAPGVDWIYPPAPYREVPGWRAVAADLRCRPPEPDPPAEGDGAAPAEAKAGSRKDSYERAIYLSPDGRILFALWIRAPGETFLKVRDKVDQIARSLKLVETGGDPLPYRERLFALNPRWQTVEGDRFRTGNGGAGPLELRIPAGLAATPLAGDHVVRLRLVPRADPETVIILRLFTEGARRIDAKQILDSSVARLASVAQGCNQPPAVASPAGITFLGGPGQLFTIDVCGADGKPRRYQIAAADHGDEHVQVQLFPGSDRIDLQEQALQSVLAALSVRPTLAARPAR